MLCVSTGGGRGGRDGCMRGTRRVRREDRDHAGAGRGRSDRVRQGRRQQQARQSARGCASHLAGLHAGGWKSTVER